MRTKHLLYTLAFAGAFTACTQDEFVAENGTDALAGRKSLGKVTFVEGADTRWAVESFDVIKPEMGDGFSLSLVDVPNAGLAGQHDYAIDNYTLSDKIWSNFFYEKGASGWTSNANLVEGNYLFVAPSQATTSRNPIEVTLPVEQQVDFAADGKTIDPLSAIKNFAETKAPFYIGHRFLTEADGAASTKYLPQMQEIFAYPLITVKNTDPKRDQKAILTKVIIKQNDASKAFVVNAPLDNKKAARLLTNEVFAPQGSDLEDNGGDGHNQVVVGTWAGKMTKYFGQLDNASKIDQPSVKADGTFEELPENATFDVTTLNADGEEGTTETYLYNKGLYGKTSDLLATGGTGAASKGQYIVINMPKGGVELEYQKPISFNVVLPADEYVLGENELVIYAVLEDDEAYEKKMKSNTEVDVFPGKQYPLQDYDQTLELKGGKGLYFTIDVNDGQTDGLSEYKKVSAASIIGSVNVADTKQELINAIKASSSTQLATITVGKGVVYDNDVNVAVASTTCQNINIQGHITVKGDVAVSSRVSFEDAVIESGKVTINSGTATLGKVFVAKDATLEVENLSTSAEAKIYNAGTLVLATTNIEEVENYAALKVAADLTSAKSIKNLYDACGDAREILSNEIDLEPRVTVLAGGKYAVEGGIDYPITVNAKSGEKAAGELVLTGTTELATASDVKKTKGTIVNNGKITDKTENGNELLIIPAGYEMTNGSSSNTEAKIDVNIRTDEEILGTTVYTPAGKLNNYGKIGDANAGLDLYINGLLVMKNSEARVEGSWKKGSEKGEIDNTAKGTLVLKKVRGTVFATISSLGDIDDDELAALNQYGEAKSNCVSEFRLAGGWTVSKDITVTKDAMNVKTIKFVANSSMKFTADATVTLNNVKIKICGKDIEWTGRTKTTTKVSATVDKGTYVGVNSDGVYVNTLEGNLEHANVGIEGDGDIDNE